MTPGTNDMERLAKVCKIFDQIEANSGRLVKQALLQELANDKEVEYIAKDLISIALDPYRHYGVRSLPEYRQDQHTPDSQRYAFFSSRIKQAELERMSPEQWAIFLAEFGEYSKWLQRALLKDLQMGVAYGTIQKVWPGLIPSFDCQNANVCEDINALQYPVYVEPKLDGLRALCFLDPHAKTAIFMSRGGNELNHTQVQGEWLLEQASMAGVDEAIVLDGEFISDNFNNSMQVLTRSESAPDPELLKRLRYHVFDSLTLKEWKATQCKYTYILRRARWPFTVLADCEEDAGDCPVLMTPSFLAQFGLEVEALLKAWLDKGLEGVMIKKPEGKYAFDRTDDWLKLKPVMEGDFEIIGAYLGDGKNKHRLGGFIVQLEEGKTNNVGGGFTDAQREEFWKHQPIGKICQVEFKGRTPDNKLREPVFARLREDK